MVNEQDKIMKNKLPSLKDLWNVIINIFRKTDSISLYEIEIECGKLHHVSNDVRYYKSEDIKNSTVKNILNERIRLLIYNRLMLFGLVTLNENQYIKTRYFRTYDNEFSMSFEMKILRQFEIKYPGIYDYIPKNSKKYDEHIRNKSRIQKSSKTFDEEIGRHKDEQIEKWMEENEDGLPMEEIPTENLIDKKEELIVEFKIMEDVREIYVNLLQVKIEVAKSGLSTSKNVVDCSNLDGYIDGLNDAIETSATMLDWIKKLKR